jgi:error-prone DNA polymerase
MYTELHARSAFSFLEGASTPEELIAVCAENGMSAMALLDRDGVYGAARFHLAAQKICPPIKAHIGAEVTATDGWRYVLLVKSREGYQNLCRLITKMKLRVAKNEGSVSSEDVAEFRKGLICLTGGAEGPLAHALENGGIPAARRQILKLTELFGHKNVYIELQRHFSRSQEARNAAAVEIARQLNLPLLATNAPNHARPEQRQILDVFTCLRHHRVLANAGRLLSRNSESHIKSPKEMLRLFKDLPEAIANTQELSARLQFTLNDLGYKFPDYPVGKNQTQMSFLRARAQEGLLRRYGAENEKAQQQMTRELALIEKLDLPGYFLIVWDIVSFCREKNILVQGRGSAANSTLCYALGITAVDPIKMDLLFERFLSDKRDDWPDIDLDLPSGDQRERAIQYVYQRYGKLGAAMTANVITYRGKSAAREIGKVLSFDAETVARLSSLVSAWEYQDSNDTLERHFRDSGFDLAQPRIKKFFELIMSVQDLPRHLGQHSGGMVICQGQLDSVVPVEPATMPGRAVVQWDKEDCADMKIVKVDLLGLGMMAVLEDSIAIIRRDYGQEVDLGQLPADDKKVYATLQKADTVGMFQIESRAQMSCLPRLHPVCFYDIVVQVAIIRPGPIVGKMVHPYLRRRQGKEKAECLHPLLENVLQRTLGVPLFQEQLLRIAMIAAGFSGSEAEELRRAFGFKRSEKRMKEVEGKLRAGMVKNGITGETQNRIIQAITSFALYGFPESHAASFALIAYASAYLKCHFLAAFTAAILNNQPMGFYSPATLVKDAQRHGLRFKPIDVTCSNWECTLEKVPEPPGHIVRIGMRYVKGLRQANAEEIVRQRAICKFTSIEDLRQRIPPMHKTELTALAAVGALNFISGERGFHRRDALWQVERAARAAGPLLEGISPEDPAEIAEPDEANAEIVTSTAVSAEPVAAEPIATELFAVEPTAAEITALTAVAAEQVAARPTSAARQNHSPLLQMTVEERVVADFLGTGLTVGPHPLTYHRAALRALGVRCAAELSKLPDGQRVRVAGAVICRQRPGTAKGFVFLSLEDETGISNAIITPQLFEKDHTVVVHHPYLLIEGRVQNLENTTSVKVEKVEPLTVTQAEGASHDFH